MLIIHFFKLNLKHRPSALSKETLAFNLPLAQDTIALRSCVWHSSRTGSPDFATQPLTGLFWSLQMSYLVLKSSAASLALSICTTSLPFSDLPHRICRGSIVRWVTLFLPSCSVSFQTLTSGIQTWFIQWTTMDTRSAEVECTMDTRKEEYDFNVIAHSPTAGECSHGFCSSGASFSFSVGTHCTGWSTSGQVTKDPCMLRMTAFLGH